MMMMLCVGSSRKSESKRKEPNMPSASDAITRSEALIESFSNCSLRVPLLGLVKFAYGNLISLRSIVYCRRIYDYLCCSYQTPAYECSIIASMPLMPY